MTTARADAPSPPSCSRLSPTREKYIYFEKRLVGEDRWGPDSLSPNRRAYEVSLYKSGGFPDQKLFLEMRPPHT